MLVQRCCGSCIDRLEVTITLSTPRQQAGNISCASKRPSALPRMVARRQISVRCASSRASSSVPASTIYASGASALPAGTQSDPYRASGSRLKKCPVNQLCTTVSSLGARSNSGHCRPNSRTAWRRCHSTMLRTSTCPCRIRSYRSAT